MKHFHHSERCLVPQSVPNHPTTEATTVLIYFTNLYKWDHSVCTLTCSTFFHSAQCFFSLSMLLHGPVVDCFLWLSSIPLCGCATISLSISHCETFRSFLVLSYYEYNCYILVHLFLGTSISISLEEPYFLISIVLH